MKEISDQSDGRIQWTGIDRDLSKLAYFKIDTIKDLSNTLGQMLATPSMILDSKPIIDGIESTWDVVNNLKPGDLNKMGGITKTMPESTQKDITSELAKRSILKNQILSLENETWEDQGWWSRNLKHAGNKEGFELRKARELANLQEQLDTNLAQELGQQFPDKNKLEAMADNANTKGSIFTHDTNLEELLKPVSKAFADGKQAPPLVMAPDNRNQSVTKLGDTYSGGLSSRVQDSTARMLAYTKNLNSTTGQFA
jgi:hypothetical protein